MPAPSKALRHGAGVGAQTPYSAVSFAATRYLLRLKLLGYSAGACTPILMASFVAYSPGRCRSRPGCPRGALVGLSVCNLFAASFLRLVPFIIYASAKRQIKRVVLGWHLRLLAFGSQPR